MLSFVTPASFKTWRVRGRYIFRMEFDPDALGNDKMLLDGVDDLLYAVRRQGRSAAAEVQAGDGLFPGIWLPARWISRIVASMYRLHASSE